MIERQVELGGPRTIVRVDWRDSRGLGVQYRFKCRDCKVTETFNHKIDAQDAFDQHRCGA